MGDDASKPGSVEADINRMISSGPDALRALLAAVRAGTAEPSELHALALASAVASKARATLSVPWLSVSNEIYEYLAQEIGGWSGQANIISAMVLRTYFIVRLGVDVRERLLQVEPISEWFLSSLPMTVEKALESSKNWKSLPIEEKRVQIEQVRILRGIKNRLRVFLWLEKNGFLEEYLTIKAWLAIFPELP